MSERKNLCVLVALHRWEGSLADQLGEDEARHASERCANRIERAISAQGGKLLSLDSDETVAVFERSDAGVQAAIDDKCDIVVVLTDGYTGFGRASPVPRCTTRAKASSSATSHATSTARIGMPPCSARGTGASFVQITKPSGHGSPEATPRVKGYSRKGAAKAGTLAAMPRPRAPMDWSNWRRSIRMGNLSGGATGGGRAKVGAGGRGAAPMRG